MAKRITGQIKLQIMAGKATPAPPVGPALGQAGVNIMDFCKAFNAKTAEKELEGLIVPVVITDQSLPMPPLTESTVRIGNWSATGGLFVEQFALDGGTLNWMTIEPKMQCPAQTRQLVDV